MQVAGLRTATIDDRFRILDESEQGGTATVFRSLDLVTEECVAIKILYDRDILARERFLEEIALLAEITHPAIVRYIAHGTTPEGDLYLAMEWLEGTTLEERLIKGAIDIVETARLARRVLEGLSEAHQRGVIHRDIKPSNLFLPGGELGQVKLLDFGIARRIKDSGRVTSPLLSLGTPMYMAPEQARGEKNIDARADLFSLGCVLFECLTGQPPFIGESPMAVLAKICLDERPSLATRCPHLPRSFHQLVKSMLAKDPEQRPAKATMLIGTLTQIIEEANAGTLSSSDLVEEPSNRAVGGFSAINEQRVLSFVMVTRLRPRTAIAFDRAKEVLAAIGARVDRFVDGSMVATLIGPGTPTDQAAQAVRCALKLKELVPGAALAVCTGRAVIRPELIVGTVIDDATRLLADELPGVIVLDDVTAELVESRFTVTGGKKKYLSFEKGLEETPRTLLGKETLCVGREREIGLLEALFEECAREATARVALMTSPAGGGKSRVRYELIERLYKRGARFEYLIGHGDPLRAGAPFAMLAPALRLAAGITGCEPLEVQQQLLRTRLARSLSEKRVGSVCAFLGEMCGIPFSEEAVSALRAARQDPRLMADRILAAWLDWIDAECTCNDRPLLLVLEDLHWGDVPSVQFVDAALRTHKNRPFMVLALGRPEVDDAFPRLWIERGLLRIALPPLSSKAVKTLVHHVLGDISKDHTAWLVERANGNPFVLEELLRAVAGGAHIGKDGVLPTAVVGMVQAHLDTLGSEARRILCAASVFGQTFRVDGVAALLGDEEARVLDGWLDTLTTREVLFTRPGAGAGAGTRELSFRHALVRDAAYDLLTEEARMAAHRRAGEWLESIGEQEAIVLIEHFERGGEKKRTVHWCCQAAAQSLKANDCAAVLERVRCGVRCGAEGETLGTLRLIEASARFWRGEYVEAETAATLARELTCDTQRLTATSELVAALGQQAKYAEVECLLKEVSALVVPPEDAGAQVLCLLRAAGYLLPAGRTDLIEHILAKVDEAGRSLEPPHLAIALDLRAKIAARAGDPVAAVAGFDTALLTLDSLGDERGVCEILISLGVTLGGLGMLEQAETCLQKALAKGERFNLEYIVASALMSLGPVLHRLGRFREARKTMERALVLADKQGDRRIQGSVRCHLANLAFRVGDLPTAEKRAYESIGLLDAITSALPAALASLGRILLATGRIDEGLEHARCAYTLMETVGWVVDAEASIGLIFAEALDASGDGAAARRILVLTRNRLEERAGAITKPEWRGRFLAIPMDHARIIQLATSWRV